MLSYQYDAAGNRTRTTWPDGFYTTTSYDALNRALQVKENGVTSLASYAWDDLSRRTTVNLGNGGSVQRSYDSQGALAGLKNFLSSTTQDVQYTYSRNQAREITSINWSNNLYQWNGATPGTQNYSTNGLNQYTAAAGATVAYQIGTRNAYTTLRLRDGETQALAGLIKEGKNGSSAGLPGLSSLPVLGRLFSSQTDNKDRSEIVLLITPRIVKSLQVPGAQAVAYASGTADQASTKPFRIAGKGQHSTLPGSLQTLDVQQPARDSAISGFFSWCS